MHALFERTLTIFNSLSNQKNVDFDVIVILESIMIEDKPSIVDVHHPNYSYEFYPYESSSGKTLFYVRNHLSYKCRKDWNVYKSYKLEPTFIEIKNPKKG